MITGSLESQLFFYLFLLLTVEKVALENVETLVLDVTDALDVERIVILVVMAVVVRVMKTVAVQIVATIVVPRVVDAVEDVLGFAPVAILRVVTDVPVVLVVVGFRVVVTGVKAVPAIVEPIVILSVAPDVKVTVELILNVKAVVPAIVLVPPTQEALVLFFKTLIKRIKIDINMTKLQVLGELL